VKILHPEILKKTTCTAGACLATCAQLCSGHASGYTTGAAGASKDVPLLKELVAPRYGWAFWVDEDGDKTNGGRWGHVAMTLGYRGADGSTMCWSTDIDKRPDGMPKYKAGKAGKATIKEITAAFGTIRYVGWSSYLPDVSSGKLVRRQTVPGPHTYQIAHTCWAENSAGKKLRQLGPGDKATGWLGYQATPGKDGELITQSGNIIPARHLKP
jgi:hypothetical protein